MEKVLLNNRAQRLCSRRIANFVDRAGLDFVFKEISQHLNQRSPEPQPCLTVVVLIGDQLAVKLSKSLAGLDRNGPDSRTLLERLALHELPEPLIDLRLALGLRLQLDELVRGELSGAFVHKIKHPEQSGGAFGTVVAGYSFLQSRRMVE